MCGVAVQLGDEGDDIDFVHGGAMLQLLEFGYLAVVAVKAVALKHRERLGMASENFLNGHFLGNHVDLPSWCI